MVLGDLEGLQTYALNGTNTYAKALRRYRDLCVEHVKAKAAPVVGVDMASGPDVTVVCEVHGGAITNVTQLKPKRSKKAAPAAA